MERTARVAQWRHAPCLPYASAAPVPPLSTFRVIEHHLFIFKAETFNLVRNGPEWSGVVRNGPQRSATAVRERRTSCALGTICIVCEKFKLACFAIKTGRVRTRLCLRGFEIKTLFLFA